jgi:DNA-binding beta-propeller fold protein YncE
VKVVARGLVPVLIGLTGAAALASGGGNLVQPSGGSGCLVDRSHHTHGCTRVRALRGPAPFRGSNGVAVSADGRNVYVASSGSDAVAVFKRAARTGRLTQAGGTAGCIAEGGAAGCARGHGLTGVNAVAVSRDGRTVYATSADNDAVTVLRRNASTGALSQDAGPAGCLSGRGADGCGPGRALSGADTVAVSPDGANVYVGAFTGNAVAAFQRDPTTGALSQPAGAAGCIAVEGRESCATGLALGAPEGVAVSPDGTAVYVAAPASSALVILRRTAGTGTLSQTQDGTGCITDAPLAGCSTGRRLAGANAVAVSANGADVYVTSLLANSVTTFSRGETSAQLVQRDGTAGCVQYLLAVGCSLGHGLSGPEAVAVAPDGATVYAAMFGSSALSVFDGDSPSGSGGLMQRARRKGCVAAKGSPECRTGRGLRRAGGLAVSPDGRNVYVAGFGSDALAVFTQGS